MSEAHSAIHATCLWGDLATVPIVAVFFRFWQIDSIPSEFFSDAAIDDVDVLDVLAGQGGIRNRLAKNIDMKYFLPWPPT